MLPNLRPYNTHKFDFCSKRCVFLGYSLAHKGYKCLEVSSGRVYVSRDVIFEEQVFPFMELHSNAGAHCRTEISLLPSHLVPSSNIESKEYDTTDPLLLMSQNPVTNVANFGDNCESVEEIEETTIAPITKTILSLLSRTRRQETQGNLPQV
jgi:hypothetical protein